MRELLKAPWSNQSVGWFVRVLAWIFVACGMTALAAGVYFSIAEFRAEDWSLAACAMVVGALYVLALFFFVAFCGKAPAGWLPWR